VPPFDVGAGAGADREAYGRPASEVFAEFDPTGRQRLDRAGAFRAPASEDGGHEVAVKILRPNMHGVIDHDLALLDTWPGCSRKSGRTASA
jgi:ubiquinone biosynthesis protein